MKEVVYGYRIRHTPELLRLAEQRTAQLDEMITMQSPPVSAEWDSTSDGEGRPFVTLRVSDFSGSATTVFTPEEMGSSPRMRVRCNRLWIDLLSVRSSTLLREFQEAEGLEVG